LEFLILKKLSKGIPSVFACGCGPVSGGFVGTVFVFSWSGISANFINWPNRR